MSITYIAPFFEKSAVSEAATYNVKALQEFTEVFCQPIGAKENNNEYIKPLIKGCKTDYLVIHSSPENFCWKSGYKKVIGITHLKNPLIEETNFSQYFSIVDEVYHDSSFGVDGVGQLRPFFDEAEYILPKKEKSSNFKFLIVGNPTCYEEIYSTIRAFSQEFRQEECVDLTVKLKEGFNPNDFGNILRNLQSDTRKYNNFAYPQIGMTNFWMPKVDLLKFYNEFDCILNCSLYNQWSRPFIDCLFLGKRCISLIDESKRQVKMAFGPSEHKDYPVGTSWTLGIAEMRTLLRQAFNGQGLNKLKKEDFSKQEVLTQLMRVFNEPQA